MKYLLYSDKEDLKIDKNNIKIIKIKNENEVLEDILYRTYNMYYDIYFIVLKNKNIKYKLKTCSYDSYGHIESEEHMFEIMEKFEDTKDLLVSNLINTETTDYYDNNEKNLVNVYLLDIEKDIKLDNEYNNLVKIIKVKNEKEIYEREYRKNHYKKDTTYIIVFEKIVLERDIKLRFDRTGIISLNTGLLENITKHAIDKKYLKYYAS